LGLVLFSELFALTEYVSAEGKTKVGMMFAGDGGQPHVEITKTVIRVCYNCIYVRLLVECDKNLIRIILFC